MLDLKRRGIVNGVDVVIDELAKKEFKLKEKKVLQVHKAYQPNEIELIRTHLWKRVQTLKYDINGYAILFSSETGVREGEIPSLKWVPTYTQKSFLFPQ